MIVYFTSTHCVIIVWKLFWYYIVMKMTQIVEDYDSLHQCLKSDVSSRLICSPPLLSLAPDPQWIVKNKKAAFGLQQLRENKEIPPSTGQTRNYMCYVSTGLLERLQKIPTLPDLLVFDQKELLPSSGDKDSEPDLS